MLGVDLQTCGLTAVSGRAFLDILSCNSSLMVVDLRDNGDVGMCTQSSTAWICLCFLHQ